MNIEELLNKLKQAEEEKQNILNENDKLKQLLQNIFIKLKKSSAFIEDYKRII